MAKKLSTEEILKAARAQSSSGGDKPEKKTAEPPTSSESAAPRSESAPATAPVESAPTGSAAAKASSGPKSTKDILAAARAQTGGGANPQKSSESAPTTSSEKTAPAQPAVGGTPKSSADILAAARAQAGKGAAAPAAGSKSTKDILAAARAQSGKATPVAAAAGGGKAVGKPAAKAVAANSVAGDHPSVQEMLKAVREGKSAESTAVAKPAESVLIIPQKPSAPALKPAVDVGEPRRGFLAKLGIGLGACVWVLFGTPFRAAWTSFTGVMGLWGLDMARFMMPNVLVEPPSKFKVGPTTDYPPAAVSTKWTAQYAVWIVHNEYKGKDIIYALQTVCTHLGCTPNWLEGERKFKCPCHGSGFYITGVNFEGPAPRPLERMAIRLAEDGTLEVDKSRKFQQELGQWEDPASYVQVG